MNKRIVWTISCALIAISAARADDVLERDTIRQTLHFPSGPRRMLVDNISGAINVEGYDGDAVELTARRTIIGDSEDKVQEAKQKVKLDFRSESDRLVVYVDAPWRCGDGGMHNEGREYYGYAVDVDFTIKVPTKTSVILKTVNHGGVSARNLEGTFEISNVNGGITLEKIAGSGKATTVNGSIVADFLKNPGAASSFRTINGRLEASFPDDLSANLRLKTFNGQVYSDFDVRSRPSSTLHRETRGMRQIYRRGDATEAQVGDGGPELSFDTLNGNIYILKREKEQ